LIIDTPITKVRGRSITGFPAEIEIIEIICIKEIIKKYTFAAFENYSYKFFGRNVTTVYFDVVMPFNL
jgi:hypothetical protein